MGVTEIRTASLSNGYVEKQKAKASWVFPSSSLPQPRRGRPQLYCRGDAHCWPESCTVLITHVFSLSSSFLNTCFIPPRNVMFSPHSHCTELVWPRRVLCVHSRKDFKVKPIYFVRATESVTLLYAPTIVFWHLIRCTQISLSSIIPSHGKYYYTYFMVLLIEKKYCL